MRFSFPVTGVCPVGDLYAASLGLVRVVNVSGVSIAVLAAIALHFAKLHPLPPMLGTVIGTRLCRTTTWYSQSQLCEGYYLVFLGARERSTKM